MLIDGIDVGRQVEFVDDQGKFNSIWSKWLQVRDIDLNYEWRRLMQFEQLRIIENWINWNKTNLIMDIQPRPHKPPYDFFLAFIGRRDGILGNIQVNKGRQVTNAVG